MTHECAVMVIFCISGHRGCVWQMIADNFLEYYKVIILITAHIADLQI
jgi:hypothetical protein